MKKYLQWSLLPGLLIAVVFNVHAQPVTGNPETICYCTTRNQSPQNIAALDNNLELLKRLLTPQAVHELQNKIVFKESQLELLKQWNLISVRNDSVETSVPWFDSIQTSAFRKISSQLAYDIVPAIIPEVKKLHAYLASLNRSKNAFSILFAYILDGKVWNNLEAEKIIAERKLTDENYLWSGEFWLLDQKRSFSCGTNSIHDNGFGFYINWSHEVIKKMWDFFGNWPAFEKLFADFQQHNRVLNDTAKSVFSPYEIFNSLGEFTVPVIYENRQDDLYAITNRLATQISRLLNDRIKMNELAQFHFRDKSQATIILYHEILWDIMDILVEKKIISKPVFFANPETATAKDAADLIFLTISK
jgi:hypothetical protein